MKNMKLNAIEMAKINGGFDEPININPDGSCANLEDCHCSPHGQSKVDYTAHRNNSDKAYGA